MIDVRWLLYSLDTDLKLKQLKAWEFCADDVDTSALQQWMQEHDIDCRIVWEDAHYKFGSIVSKPYIVYSQWDISLLDKPLIAIVWPRKASNYHQQVMEDFFAILSKYDVVTISGWAPGVDTQCHQLSMQYQIPTVMVLGWWFGHYLNSTKRYQLKAVQEAGWLVLSEFRLKEKPTKRSFPQRNRIVAWLSETIFLPGAAIGSGSLITVDFGLQMHKDIYSVPASIYENESMGTNDYISQRKIHAITDFEVFLDTYFVRRWAQEQSKALNLNETETAIVVSLREHGWLATDRLSQLVWLSTGDLLVQMMELEMKGAIWEQEVGVWSVK